MGSKSNSPNEISSRLVSEDGGVGEGQIRSSRLLVVYNPNLCHLHNGGGVETGKRVEAVINRLHSTFNENIFVVDEEEASEAQLLLAHSAFQIELFLTLSSPLKSGRGAHSRRLQVKELQDNIFSEGTKEAVLLAAHFGIHSLGLIFDQRRTHRVFCVTRPPGHHAGYESMEGFCYFNNAAITALYALDNYSNSVERVAVLDFDVHHGNGTEEILKEKMGCWYGSTYQENIYPVEGVPKYSKDVCSSNGCNRRLSKHCQSQEFRVKWKQVVAAMIEFEPDLVIISAGFDAHRLDKMSNTRLVESDFGWATECILQALLNMNPLRDTPVISLLEGGYNVKVLESCVEAHCSALAKEYYPTQDISF